MNIDRLSVFSSARSRGAKLQYRDSNPLMFVLTNRFPRDSRNDWVAGIRDVVFKWSNSLSVEGVSVESVTSTIKKKEYKKKIYPCEEIERHCLQYR